MNTPRGDRYVGWAALVILGWLLGAHSAGREPLDPETIQRPVRECQLQQLPATPKAAKLWAQRYRAAAEGVILK